MQSPLLTAVVPWSHACIHSQEEEGLFESLIKRINVVLLYESRELAHS